MSICSIGFLLFAAVVPIAFHACRDRRLRLFVLGAANLFFLVAIVPNRRSWTGLAVFVIGSYAILKFLKSRPSPFRIFAAITFVCASFVYVKKYTFLSAVLPVGLWPEVRLANVEIIGLSYMLFKFIHMVVDQWQEQLQPYSFLSYSNYQLSFFTLVAGPIQRYNDFQAFWEDAGLGPADARDSLAAWSRILTGMFKVGVFSAIALRLFDDAGQHLLSAYQTDLFQRFAVYFYAYPVYLYFNFSGYTDIVIGVAQLLGLKLPENFNRPFLARNIIDYWNRWHITLTHWVRDYIFMTSYKWAVERFPSLSRLAGYVLLFFALFVAGLWHGSTSGFAAFGLLHGIGVATNRIYGDILQARLGRTGVKRYESNKLVRIAAIVLTFHFVCFTFLFFSSGIPRTMEILRLLSTAMISLHAIGAPVAGHVAIAAAAIILILVTLWKDDALVASFGRIGKTWRTSSLYWLVVGKALVITLILLSLWAVEFNEPSVVYMRF